LLVLETCIKKVFKTKRWSNHKRNTREGSWWNNASILKVVFQDTIWIQILCKWTPISSLLKTLLLKLSTNGYPCIFCVHELFFSSYLQMGSHISFLVHKFFFSSSLQMGTHVFFAQEFFFSNSLQINTHVLFSEDLCKITSCRSNFWYWVIIEAMDSNTN
jgi:hypothetical protein